jgi:NAD(P)-dependent dehydrogenase (short-subunit alcohol dehydrogenase family)
VKFSLAGKVVLISGASGGIGLGLAEACVARGARVAMASRNLRACQALAKRSQARAYALDVRRPASVKSAVSKVLKDLGGIDVLVNNAGVHMFSDVASMPEAALAGTFDTNVFGPLRMIQAVLPGMRRRGSGMIVQIGSTLAYRSLENIGGYSASKAALQRLTESLRMELAGTGIRVLDISPGVVKTQLRKNAWFRGKAPAPAETLPFARSVGATAEEIADAMEAGRRDLMSAAWPVRLAMKYLSVLAPGFLDRQLAGKN